jgi:HD-like signal output (HDOD) protein
MRLLLVDPEPRVLEGLSRLLFELEPSWQLLSARSGTEAIAQLADEACDVVVTERSGPELDGVALLARIAELHPCAARVVLTSAADDVGSAELSSLAHQLLPKPCPAETLHGVVSRLQQLARAVPERRMQALAARAEPLPCDPEAHLRLRFLLGAQSSPRAIADAVRADPGLTCKLLQLAAFGSFGGLRGSADLEQAVVRLGTAALRRLLGRVGALLARPSSPPTTSALDIARARSRRIAELAASMARLPEDAAVAHTAGLLCDVGQLLLLRAAPERIYVSQAEAAQRGILSHVAERATWGATHAELGAYLLGLWGLPFQLVETVAHHHQPERSGDERVGLTQWVWLSACIVDGEEPAAELLARFGAEEPYLRAQRRYQAG